MTTGLILTTIGIRLIICPKTISMIQDNKWTITGPILIKTLVLPSITIGLMLITTGLKWMPKAVKLHRELDNTVIPTTTVT